MGKLYHNYINNSKDIFVCTTCACHLAKPEDIVSTSFKGQHGKAYLFGNVINIHLGEQEARHLITGKHVVCDIFCNVCMTVLGWKYEYAYSPDQKYKEGKYVIEKIRMEKITELDPP
eukprot:TRINITY_DN93608_c0_g1_i1.p1 TRINITY_DN93608_c0_g1~~TRINITY_DN93608_c0_g1_i1.p1  ORF type:complete len:117 (+),score=4.76 TRINITY_DN93608_c0_g1_i1:34-384(+)